MKEQFVTYEIALKLKELGFSQEPPRLGGYDKEGKLHYRNISRNDITAPLWQQVIDWFRCRHDCYITTNSKIINEFGQVRISWHVLSIKDFKNRVGFTSQEGTELSLNSAILKAIELIKNKSK